MRKIVFGCLGAAAVAFALQFTPANVHAGLFDRLRTPCDEAAQCDPCEPCGLFDDCVPCDPVCGTKAGKWFLTGHIDAGFFANAHGQKSVYNGGYRGLSDDSGNTAWLQNTRLTGAQINQVYLSLGKSVDGKRGLDIGGTVDFTWGSDAYIAQSAGLETETGRLTNWGTGDYYAAFAQAYAEIEYHRWNVKIGKFYAPFGIGGYKSTDNFFYTWDPNKGIAPTTAGGAYATYTVNDRLSVLGGWVMPDEIGDTSKNNAVLGGILWSPTKRLDLAYTFAAGADTRGTDDIDYFIHSLVANVQISKRLKYVFDWTYNHSKETGDNTDVYGLNNEIIYQFNKKWSFGTRFGMLGGNLPAYFVPNLFGTPDKVEWYNVSLGANWTPNKWLTVKPEVRYDWTDKTAVTIFNDSSSTYQLSGGVSAVVKF